MRSTKTTIRTIIEVEVEVEATVYADGLVDLGAMRQVGNKTSPDLFRFLELDSVVEQELCSAAATEAAEEERAALEAHYDDLRDAERDARAAGVRDDA